jgi:hypothetical protein
VFSRDCCALRTGPRVVSPPANFQPQVPAGFKVSVFARGFAEPRSLAVAPNGDVFVADSAAGEVVVLHDQQGQGRAQSRDIFADHQNLPFGIAFRNDYAYATARTRLWRKTHCSIEFVSARNSPNYGMRPSTEIGGPGTNCPAASEGCGVFYSLNLRLASFVSFLPPQSAGKVGKRIGIFGQGFTGTTCVSFNGTPANFRVAYDTSTVTV